MAEVLESFAFPKTIGLYPWAQWADGQIWKIHRGTDFAISTSAFRNSLRGKAARLNRLVHTAIVDDDAIVFQFYDKPDK